MKRRLLFILFPTISPNKTTLKVLAGLLAIFAINLCLVNSAFATTKRVTAVTYGTQSSTPTYGTACSCATYTITLSEAGTAGGAVDNIQLTWATGTPAGVTWAFTSGTETITSGNTTTPSFTPSGSNSTITFTVTTSGSTPAGSYGFTLKITDNNGGGGSWSSTGLTFVISPKVLTITGLTANSKIYDRTTVASLSGTGTLNGVIGADVVTLGGSPTAVFASFNVAAGISVTVTGYTLGGANAGNYTLTQPTGLTGDITPKALTVTLAIPSNKVYDGTTTATVTGGVLLGIVLPDIVTVSTTGTFASPNAGNGITVAIALTGANAGNYMLTQPGVTANITPASLTVTATNVSKVYGTSLTNGAGSTAFTSSGLKNGETIGSVTVTYGSGSAVNDPVGTYNGQITPSAATGGTFTASNYSISYVTGNITVTAATLTITGLTANNKTYNRTTAATLSGTATLSGVVTGDVVTLGGTPVAVFASANAGTGIAVTVTGYTISGANAGNYTLTQPTGLTANITALALTVTGAVAGNKVYDGTTTATVTGTLSGVISPDVVTLNGSGVFPSKNVGSGLAVTSTCTLSGANSANYTLTQPIGLTANITVKTLTISGVTASNKVYDGTTAATLSGTATLNGLIAGDVVTLGGSGTGTFASKNVGTGIAVTVTTYSLSGADAGNYTLTQPSGLTANITAAPLTITATGPLKVTGFISPVVTGSTTNFIYYGTVAGETITSVTLTPNPTTSQTTGSTYTVTPSAAAGASGYISSNYTITYSVYSGTVAGFSYTWTGNSSTTWGTSTNWSPNGTPGSTDNVSIPATANAPTLTANASVNTITFTGNNTITVSSAKNLVVNSGFNVNPGVTAAGLTFLGSSTSTIFELNSAIFANYGNFTVTGSGIFEIDNNGSYIYNSGTFTAGGDVILYLQGGSNTTHALTNAGTFYAGTSGSACYLEMDDYGSIDNSGNFYLGPTSAMYYYNDNAQNVIVNNQSGGTFTLRSDATGSATVGEIPQGNNNVYTGTFNVERYFQGGTTYSSGRWVERSYRIISSCVNTGTTVNGNYVYGLNYIAGSTAGQTTTANSLTNAFITGCTGGSTSGGNPSVYLYTESRTPSNSSFTSGNFLGITNITNSTTGGTITASDGGTYSIPVGSGVLFFFRGAATNWSTRTVPPFIAPENVTLTSTGKLNTGSYTFKNWYSATSSNLGYSGSGTGTNYQVRGFNMVGNPYPCAIDWNSSWSGTSGIARTNIAPTIWVFNPVTYQYDTYMATSSSGGASTGNASRYIASGQGFFVLATATNPSLTINEYAKVSLNNNGAVGKVSFPAAAQLTGSNLLMSTTPVQDAISQNMRLKLAADSTSFDDIVFLFNSNASRSYSPLEDARYLSGINAAEGLASFSDDNVALSINNMPFPNESQQEIKLHVVGIKSGIYTVKMAELNAIPQIYEIWLMDKYKKDSLDLRNNKSYAFNIDLTDTASFGNNRFSLVLRQSKALAVQLLSFTASGTNNGSQVNWTTAYEQNYTNFTVERSTDEGNTFTVLGGVSASGLGNYGYLDKSPFKGANLYRLKIEDLNGKITYSNVVTVMYSNTGSLITNNILVYPNPTKGALNLNIVAPNTTSLIYNIKIVNSTGLVIKSGTTTLQSWETNVSTLLPGSYVVQVTDKNDNLIGRGTFVKL